MSLWVIQLGRRSTSLGSSRKAKWLVGFIVLTLLGGVAVVANFDWIRGQYQKLTALDYQGPGTGEVVVRIEAGEDGLVIAKKLFEAGVVRDVDSFYRLLLEKNPIFYPGSFTLRLQMSNDAALKAVTDQANILSGSWVYCTRGVGQTLEKPPNLMAKQGTALQQHNIWPPSHARVLTPPRLAGGFDGRPPGLPSWR